MFSSISKILNTKKWKRFFTVSRIQVNGPISSPVADNIQPTGIYRHSWISSTSLPGLTVRKSPGNEIGCCILSEWKVKNAVRQFWLAWPFVSRKSQKVKKKFMINTAAISAIDTRALTPAAHVLWPLLHTRSDLSCTRDLLIEQTVRIHMNHNKSNIFLFSIYFCFFVFKAKTTKENTLRQNTADNQQTKPT